MSKKYLMANPNFSEAENMEVVERIIDEIRDIEEVTLVKYEPESSFNRTVVTLIGEEEALLEALVKLTAKCVELIDMRKHEGGHPRMGAMDVIPVFPFKNTTMDDVTAFCKKLGVTLFEKTKVPVFYIGECASCKEREKLPFVRKGQFEGLRDLLKAWKDAPSHQADYEMRKPDLSVDGLLDERAGGTVIAPMEEIAAFFNVFIDTEDVEIAKKIAGTIRSASGGFATVTAIGTKFEGRQGSVVSMNVMDCSKTPIYRPFEVVKMEAERYGARVTGSELVGIVRLDFMVSCFEHMLQLEGFKKEHIVETHLM